MNFITIKNNQTVPVSSIPILGYDNFLEQNISLLKSPHHHCLNYFGVPQGNNLKLICCIANDLDHIIYVSSSVVSFFFFGEKEELGSFTAHNLAFHFFEREIHEKFGIKYLDHPWLKPARFLFDRADKNSCIENYPFFAIDSEELHEVGVGPIHAGVIEPGHFRFICNGEQILHLEIQLGFQHRGIENLFLNLKKLVQLNSLAENIAGDTVAGHSMAFSNLWESLCDFKPDENLSLSRSLALELERIAIHTGDLSAMCTDVAYQLGSAVFGRLRTPLINFFQVWCGNRLAKGLIRAGKNNYPFTGDHAINLKHVLDLYEPDFDEMCKETFNLPTLLGRFEKTGVVTMEQAMSIGTVGMSARMTNISRDIRLSHPHDYYLTRVHDPVLKNHGDVYSRAQIRKEEIKQSIGYIKEIIGKMPGENRKKAPLGSPTPNSFAISLVEGWRGEICHCAITDEKGELAHYKVKDPSIHNWLALALAVRNNEISDFPICNKSFNLSYCGHDL